METTLGGHGAIHQHLVWLAALVAFTACAFGLILLYRRVSGRVELEQAEALLAQEYDELETSQSADSDPAAII